MVRVSTPRTLMPEGIWKPERPSQTILSANTDDFLPPLYPLRAKIGKTNLKFSYMNSTTTLLRLTQALLFSLFALALPAQPLYQNHWVSGSDPEFSGSAAATLTQSLDSTCSLLTLSVADPAASPMPEFNAIILNPQLPGGAGDLTDLSGNMSFHVRVRSRDSVRLGLQLRAGDGSSTFRTDRLEVIIPGDTTAWTEHTFIFDASTLAGFDSTDLRDVWFFLDRGDENFAGNEFLFDYFAIGAAPDTSTFSTCPADTGSTDPMVNDYLIHWTSSNDPTFSGSGGDALTQTLDSACSYLRLSVTDPVGAPLPAFSPLIINPQLPGGGGDLTDLSGNLSFFLRVRSRDTVNLGFLLRAGDGSSALRTDRLETEIPGDSTAWTEVVFTFDSSSIGGFDSTDLRDIWLYLDPGEENFAGDEFLIDYFAIGTRPDPALDSDCVARLAFDFPWVLHFADTTEGILGGSESVKYDQIIDPACSQLSISVIDPAGDPHQAFKPIVINPQGENGEDLVDLSGQMRFFLRARSLAEVEVAMLARAGDGSDGLRTEIVRQIIPAGLEAWTTLEYTFTGTDLAGFDSTDLRDFWIFLDRDQANFPGNEFYLDFLSIGALPDSATWSDCVATTHLATESAPWASVGPNPLVSGEALQVFLQAQPGTQLHLRLMNLAGQEVANQQQSAQAGMDAYTWNLPSVAPGLYLLEVQNAGRKAHFRLSVR